MILLLELLQSGLNSFRALKKPSLAEAEAFLKSGSSPGSKL